MTLKQMIQAFRDNVPFPVKLAIFTLMALWVIVMIFAPVFMLILTGVILAIVSLSVIAVWADGGF